MRSDRPPRSPPPSLDAPALERLALRYVERFATTRGRLADYLRRKLRERGWAGGEEPDPAALAERLAALGYIDDRVWAEGKAAAMGRRGLGARRVGGALRQARVDEEDMTAVAPAIDARAWEAAVAFARRRRIGAFAAAPADRDTRERQIAAMARAGHPVALARRLAEAAPGVLPEDDGAALDGCDEGEP